MEVFGPFSQTCQTSGCPYNSRARAESLKVFTHGFVLVIWIKASFELLLRSSNYNIKHKVTFRFSYSHSDSVLFVGEEVQEDYTSEKDSGKSSTSAAGENMIGFGKEIIYVVQVQHEFS